MSNPQHRQLWRAMNRRDTVRNMSLDEAMRLRDYIDSAYSIPDHDARYSSDEEARPYRPAPETQSLPVEQSNSDTNDVSSAQEPVEGVEDVEANEKNDKEGKQDEEAEEDAWEDISDSEDEHSPASPPIARTPPPTPSLPPSSLATSPPFHSLDYPLCKGPLSPSSLFYSCPKCTRLRQERVFEQRKSRERFSLKKISYTATGANYQKFNSRSALGWECVIVDADGQEGEAEIQ